ncbi:MAG: bifunctional folylpolyglutamate synthase/dihydrofolate synthase, partial [Kiritimatiellae bacterium]|nr:bifunctional folylpolyglutamate synthase/dihydrofolate synthase [Kiritimatiellia bacterium]
ARMGNPERELAAVHIAGTNGKGSVAAMVASVLQASGLTVGRYTSPHLLHFNERICVNGVPAGDDDLEALLRQVEAASDASVEHGEATFFECATAAAFEYFRRQHVRLAVIETGLGGRLDATNVLTPVLAVITRIGLEHCEHLGATVELIAAEKAGIVKPGRPVVIGAMPAEAGARIRDVAAALGAPLTDAVQSVTVTARNAGLDALDVTITTEQRDLGRLRVGLAGAYQLENIATAVAALDVWSQATGMELDDAAFKSGLAAVRWPGRFQKVRREPTVIVDGGHNPVAAEALKQALRRARLGKPVGLVAGFCDDKNVAAFLHTLAGSVRRAWAVPVPSPRTLPAADTAGHMRRAGMREVTAFPTLSEALAQAEAWAATDGGALLICGSLFLAGEALQHYNAFPWTIRSRAADANEQLKETP